MNTITTYNRHACVLLKSKKRNEYLKMEGIVTLIVGRVDPQQAEGQWTPLLDGVCLIWLPLRT